MPKPQRIDRPRTPQPEPAPAPTAEELAAAMQDSAMQLAVDDYFDAAEAASRQQRLSGQLKTYMDDQGLAELANEGGTRVLVRGKGQEYRYLDFEPLTDQQIVTAARLGILTLDVGQYDAMLKSNNLRDAGFARELGPHVRKGERAWQLTRRTV